MASLSYIPLFALTLLSKSRTGSDPSKHAAYAINLRSEFFELQTKREPKELSFPHIFQLTVQVLLLPWGYWTSHSYRSSPSRLSKNQNSRKLALRPLQLRGEEKTEENCEKLKKRLDFWGVSGEIWWRNSGLKRKKTVKSRLRDWSEDGFWEERRELQCLLPSSTLFAEIIQIRFLGVWRGFGS